jgi:hypothetical protein
MIEKTYAFYHDNVGEPDPISVDSPNPRRTCYRIQFGIGLTIFMDPERLGLLRDAISSRLEADEPCPHGKPPGILCDECEAQVR